MAADQAAGLRRRQSRRPPHCLHLLSSNPDSARGLAHALFRHGWHVLLVDTQGRLFGDASRSLFDWRQQLARQQWHALQQPWGDGWHAPGAHADALAPSGLAAPYDCLLFDAVAQAPAWQAVPQAAQTLALDVKRASLQPAYALLKTLAHHACRADVVLLGEAAACMQLQAACRRFLDPAFAHGIGNLSHEADAFAALAVRMAGEETDRQAVVG